MRSSALTLLLCVLAFTRTSGMVELPGSRVPIPEDRRQTILTLAALQDAGRLIRSLTGPETVRPGFAFAFTTLLLDPRPNQLTEEAAREVVDVIERATDCDDFRVAMLIRFWHLARNRGNLPDKYWDDIRRVLLELRYYYGTYIDNPRIDARWYDSENHMLCFHSDEYLAGELFPKELFKVTGKTGTWHRDRARGDILQWISERAKRGFTEFDSNSYYDIDVLALTNLYDFAQDPEVKKKAGMTLDLILADMVVDSIDGIFGTPHSRAYPSGILGARKESTRSVQWLLFGTPSSCEHVNFGAICLATSGYAPPAVVVGIACDSTSSFEHIERHPLIVKRTYRTPDYMLSGILSEAMGIPTRDLQPKGIVRNPERAWRKGRVSIHNALPGNSSYQLHAWQATLDDDAVVFTSQPASLDLNSRPNLWCGQYANPKIFQRKSLLVSLHNLDAAPDLPIPRLRFSHAYFPKEAFDEVVEKNNWIIGRRGDGYLALYCAIPYDWAPGSLFENREIRAYGNKNAWICQMGRRDDGDFEDFVSRLTGSTVKYNPAGPGITFDSLHQKTISVNWEGPTTIDGKEVKLPSDWRFKGPFAESKHMSGKYRFSYGDDVLELDFNR